MCKKMSENNAVDNKKMSEKKKCGLKCTTCHNYERESDFCVEKGIEECSKQIHTDFSQCDSYLVNSKLVMF